MIIFNGGYYKMIEIFFWNLENVQPDWFVYHIHKSGTLFSKTVHCLFNYSFLNTHT